MPTQGDMRDPDWGKWFALAGTGVVAGFFLGVLLIFLMFILLKIVEALPW